jgi:hypothetical protein
MYLEYIDLTQWQTQKSIRETLKSKGIEPDQDLRSFRREVQSNNRAWAEGKSGFYIVHDNYRGYKAATSVEEIDRSLADLEKRSFSMLKATRRARMALGNVRQGSYNNLREIRQNRGLTGMALVRLMKEKDPKFDSPTLSRIENGKVLPTPETLSQLAEILECETWEIVNPQYLM